MYGPLWTAMGEAKRLNYGPQEIRDMMGFIPDMLDIHERGTAAEQFDAAYQHGGGWSPFNGFKLRGTATLVYAAGDDGEPEEIYQPLAMCIFKQERVYFYDNAWVMILQPDGAFEVARMD